MTNDNTLGEICAGIGGFSLGFEQAGWRTAWQIELDDVNRAVLAHRFPGARHCRDLRDWRSFDLPWVKCIAARKDKSRTGLAGSRSGLFFEIMEIIGALRPESELFVAEENGWDQMVERQRAAEIHGLPCGLDASNAEEAYAAGNAVPPPIAKWIAEILNRSWRQMVFRGIKKMKIVVAYYAALPYSVGVGES